MVIVLVAGLCILAGIFGASLVPFGLLWPLVAFAPAAIVLLIAGRRSAVLSVAAVAVLAVALGAARLELHRIPRDAGQIGLYADGGRRAVRGHVSAPPLVRDRAQQFEIDVAEVWHNESWRQVSGVVRIITRPFPRLEYGARVELTGPVEPVAWQSPPGYARYLERRGVQAVSPFPRLAIAPGTSERASGAGGRASLALHRLRGRLAESINRQLPEPHAALLNGVLLGERSAIPLELNDRLNRTGTSHLIAISGFNVAIVVGALTAVVSRLVPWRIAAAPPVILGVLLYVLLVGAAPSVVRAAIMGSMALVAPLTGRQAHAFTSLVWAAAFMALHNPLVLWDIGFQLSFLATAGILLLGPPLDRMLRWIPDLARETVAVTLAAQIAVLPVLSLTFQRVPIAGLIANLLAIPLFPPIMFSGAALASIAAIAPAVAAPAAWLVWLLLEAFLRIVQESGRLPLATLDVPAVEPQLLWAAPVYALIAALVWLARRSGWSAPPTDHFTHYIPPRRTLAFGGLAAALTLAAVALWHRGPAGLQLLIPDVPEGQLALVRAPGEAALLLNGGPLPSRTLELVGRELPYWQRRLDVVVAADLRESHLAGLIPVLERYDVGLVLDAADRHPSATYRRFREVIAKRHIQRHRILPGDRYQIGESLILEALPLSGLVPALAVVAAPEEQLALRLHWGGAALLLTGDQSAANLRSLASLAAQSDLADANLLVLPARAARLSAAQRLIEAVASDAVVIQGHGRSAAPVLPQLSSRPAYSPVIYRTSDTGAIRVTVDASGVSVRPITSTP